MCTKIPTFLIINLIYMVDTGIKPQDNEKSLGAIYRKEVRKLRT